MNAPTSPAFGWTLHSGGLALVTVAAGSHPLNLLGREHVRELAAVVAELADARHVHAVVFASEREAAFSAGFDLRQLASLGTVHDGIDFAREVQRLTARLEQLEVPVVFALHGACLGLGLDLALAGTLRIATHDPRTRLGFPEVKLGLLPVGGATQRLPARLGPDAALELLLGGEPIGARRALRLGLVDEVVAPGLEVRVALERAQALARSRTQKGGWTAQLAARLAAVGRGLIDRPPWPREWPREQGEPAGRELARRRLVDAVRTGLERGLEAGLERERRGFGELVTRPDRVALTAHWFARCAARRATSGGAGSAGGGLGLLGVAPSGLELAQAALSVGLPVRIADPDPSALTRAATALRRQVAVLHTIGELDSSELARRLGSLTTSTIAAGFRGAELLVEPDEVATADAGRRLRLAEASAPEAAVLAVGTRGAVADVASQVTRPERLLGWRAAPGLVELGITPNTAPDVVSRAAGFVARLGWVPVVVPDTPARLFDRLRWALADEALRLSVEGHVDVDATLTGWGFGAGPLAAGDQEGWGELTRVAARLPSRVDPPGFPALVATRAPAARRERPTQVLGRWWRSRPPPNPETLLLRCVLRLVNEAARCFREGVVAEARDLDLTAVYALGFPAHRGGPLWYADQVGALELTRRLDGLAAEHGPRFRVDPLLASMARSGASFFGEARVFPESTPSTETLV